MKLTRLSSSILILLLLVIPAIAQLEDSFFPKLKSVPELSVSDDVRRGSLAGEVRVYVKVDRDGNVTQVGDAFGPGGICGGASRSDVIAIRKAAKEAAKQAKFEPLRPDQRDWTWVRFDFRGSSALVETDLPRFLLSPKNPELRDQILSLPKPQYPPAARAVRAAGAVSVELRVSKDGSVFSSEPLNGHPLLRASASQAACSAKFRPPMLSGNSVEAIWIITYNFAP